MIPSLVGHTLLNWSVRRVAAHVVALAILGEPIGETTQAVGEDLLADGWDLGAVMVHGGRERVISSEHVEILELATLFL